MVQPKDPISFPEHTVWKKVHNDDSLTDLRNVENFSLSDINVIKKVANFILKKGNPLDSSVKDAIVGKLDNQIKEIKRDTSGIINWFRYLFSRSQMREKQKLASCSEELKNLILGKALVPNADDSEELPSSDSSPSESQNSSSAPSPLLGLNSQQAEGTSEEGPPPPPPPGFAPPPPPPGNGFAPPPPPPFGAAPKAKEPEKFFRDEPKEPDFDPKVNAQLAKDKLAGQILQIEDYLEAKKTALGLIQPSKDSPKGSPRSNSSNLAAASKKVSDAGEQAFGGDVDELLARVGSRTPSSKPSLKSKTPSTPAKAPAKAKTDDILKEIKISLLILFEKDPEQIVGKVKSGTIAEKVTLINVLKEKLTGLEEVRKERLARMNSARKKFEAFSQKGDVFLPIQLGKKDENPITEIICFYERDEDFFRENEKRKKEGDSILPDSLRKSVMQDYFGKEFVQDQDNFNAVMAQIGQIEGILKSLEKENNNGIAFTSDAAGIFKGKIDTLKKWEKALLDRKRKLEEKPPQVQLAKKDVVKAPAVKKGFDRLDEVQDFKILKKSPAGLAQKLVFEEKK